MDLWNWKDMVLCWLRMLWEWIDKASNWIFHDISWYLNHCWVLQHCPHFNLLPALLDCWGCSPFEPFLLGRRHRELLRRWCLTWTSKTRQEKLCQPLTKLLTKLLKTLHTRQYWSRNLGPRDNMFLVMQSTIYSPLSEIEETKKAQGQRKKAGVLGCWRIYAQMTWKWKIDLDQRHSKTPIFSRWVTCRSRRSVSSSPQWNDETANPHTRSRRKCCHC